MINWPSRKSNNKFSEWSCKTTLYFRFAKSEFFIVDKMHKKTNRKNTP